MTYQAHRWITLRISPIQAVRPADMRAAILRQRELAQAEIIRIRAESTATKAAKS